MKDIFLSLEVLFRPRGIRRRDVSLVIMKKKIGNMTGYIMILPVVAIISVFTIYPLFYAIKTSLYEILLARPFLRPYVGYGNYLEVIKSYYFFKSLLNSLVYAAMCVFMVTVVGLGVSLLLNCRYKITNVLRIIIVVPWAIPFVVSGVMWKWIFNSSYGAFNGLLYSLGITDAYVSWLGHPLYAKICLAIAHAWKEIPFAAILFLAVLQTIPRELYDAVRVDGGTSWMAFKYVTLPLIKPVLLVVVIWETVIGFTMFDLVYVMTGGGPGDSTSLISWYTYAETFKFLNLGKGAALSILLALIVLAMIIIYLKVIRVEQVY